MGADRWLPVARPPWSAGPNRGFRLIVDDVVVGAYAAVYSSRETPEGALHVCNLAAFFVLPEYRPHSLRLVRALLGQKGYLFTDLSPSGNVPAMNERLGFARLDTATRLAVNVAGRAGRHVEDGLGLGLFVTRFLVEAHGGAITVQSDEGQGAAFAVHLPYQPAS